MRFAICPINETWTASAFELATEVFVRHSNLNQAVGADLSSYRAYVATGFYRDVADGLSLIADDRTQKTVMGVLITRDFITPATPQLDDPRYAPIVAVTSHLKSIDRRQRQISAGEVALVDMAAVHPDYAGQGVYRALRMALATHGFARGYRYIAGELSSAVTQRLVLEHLQLRDCAELVLADFIYEGKRPFAAIKTLPKIILAEGPTPPPSA